MCWTPLVDLTTGSSFGLLLNSRGLLVELIGAGWFGLCGLELELEALVVVLVAVVVLVLLAVIVLGVVVDVVEVVDEVWLLKLALCNCLEARWALKKAARLEITGVFVSA